MTETIPDDGRKYYADQEEGWCAWCGETLPMYRHWRTTFCNKRCNNAYFNSLITDARAENRAKLVCVTCGEPIQYAKRADAKYCSRAHCRIARCASRTSAFMCTSMGDHFQSEYMERDERSARMEALPDKNPKPSTRQEKL
ncbi:MAG: hypothetical protein WA975_05065 [Mesorhizobium sp.]